MMKSLMVIVLGVLLVSGLSTHSALAVEKTINLEFAVALPKMNQVTMLLMEMSEEIGKRTKGKVKITVHPGSTLVPTDQAYDAVVRGIVDIGFGFLGSAMGRFPLMEVMDLPLGAKSGYTQSKLLNAFYEKFQPKELDDSKVLFFVSAAPAILHSQKPIRNLEDLNNLKIRVGGGTVADMMSCLGAVPVAMPNTDAYDALRKGMLNGTLGPYSLLRAFKMGDVVKYSTECYRTAGGSTGFVVMNRKRWNSLPLEVKKTIKEAAEEYAEKTAKGYDDYEQKGKGYIVENGNEIITLTKSEENRWVERVKPLFNRYLEDKTAKGLPAQEALTFCQQFLVRNQ